ncbi:MAG TPA: flavodoxin [Mitsuokella multacida]|jgi:flavodoxin short chain|uniref:flavodoxin n=1 Tax=Mitsuokella multacida TaxID=52226 RepID=UPI000E7D9BE4|nr:flavodoxin [Mitsuokella multacida]HBQ29806.1 flavodoxin [Mitsuokella multacida]
MSKIAIIYWTGTGNTLEMARAIEKGAKDAGATVEVFEVESFGGVDRLKEYDGLMFGCPAMGDEVLEEGAFEPFFAEAESHLQGVPVALFGSYGWGGGAWMESWAERTRTAGAKLFGDGLAIENAPDDEGTAACEALGKEFAEAL